MKTKLNVGLDKLENEYLKDLRERTGKSDEELAKLAIQALHEKLCENKRPELPAAPVTPAYIPYFVPYYPFPYNPYPHRPYPEITWDGVSGDGSTIIFNDNITITAPEIKINDASNADVSASCPSWLQPLSMIGSLHHFTDSGITFTSNTCSKAI